MGIGLQAPEGVRISIFRLENNLSLQRINESALTGDTEFIREIIVNMSDCIMSTSKYDAAVNRAIKCIVISILYIEGNFKTKSCLKRQIIFSGSFVFKILFLFLIVVERPFAYPDVSDILQ